VRVPLTRDEDLEALLRRVHTIAVVGIKDGESDDAFRVPAYMQRHGYEILPVSPKLDRVLEHSCVPSVTDLDQTPELVNLFRASPHIPFHAEEILALSPAPLGVWLQLGISHAEASAKLEAAGIAVVEDRCLMVEHARLLGSSR
jgi:hypothetical protein